MNKVKKVLFILLYMIAVILALCSVLSLFRNAEIRYLKMLDFPRIQFFIASLICLVLLWILIKRWKWHHILLIFGLLGGLFIHGYFLINYTSIVSVEVPWSKNSTSAHTQVSILLSNVKMTNRNTKTFINLIESKKPDLILAMEVDAWWNKELKVLENDYPYSQHTINEVTYGMILYSKFPLEKIDVDYLNNKNVPSFETTISLVNDKKIRFYAIHPVPPTHFKNLPDNEGQRETSLEQLGNKIEHRKLPTIVAGDLNDVVWSYVDDLTDTKHLLFDVRVGRGFYSSFNAENLFMRWPLDHVFVTEEFKLKTLERLPKIGSDHYPIFVELTF